jgi:hypothetical protein
MSSQENTKYHLQMFHQLVSNQLRIIEWAQTVGFDEVLGLAELLPNPLFEFQGELVITGRISVDHFDDIDPLLTQLQHRIGNLVIDSDEPELRVRVYRASGHPYLSVKLRVAVNDNSGQLLVSCRPNENPFWDYYWIDQKRER